MTPSLEDMTRDELRRVAKQHGIALPAKARKAELVAALQSAPVAGTKSQTEAAKPAACGSAETQKYTLRGDAPAPEPHDVPWGYDETRITAMARDPHWLYAYWEVTDAAVSSAQERLGQAGANAGLCLRVYDTTFRQFDGTNANSYFDIPVERTWRNYFIKVEKSRSVFHIEVGAKSHEGFFASIARSGAATMPADSMSGSGGVEWMTVVPHQQPPKPPPYHHRYTPRPQPVSWQSQAPGHHRVGAKHHHEHAIVWHGDVAHALHSLLGTQTNHGEWFEQIQGGRFIRWITWHGTRQQISWRSGPTTISWQHHGPIEVWYEGQRRTLQFGPHHGGQIELGPWHIVISGIDAHGERRLFDTWMVHMSWGGILARERIESVALYRRIFGAYGRREILAGASEVVIREEAGASQELFAGASERWWAGASEMLLGGATETWAQGASEIWALGASETLYQGASETQWGGASVSLTMGASERGLLGSSETVLGGASLFGGASMLGGASERAFGGASEQLFQGSSEAFVGASGGAGWSGFSLAPAPSSAKAMQHGTTKPGAVVISNPTPTTAPIAITATRRAPAAVASRKPTAKPIVAALSQVRVTSVVAKPTAKKSIAAKPVAAKPKKPRTRTVKSNDRTIAKPTTPAKPAKHLATTKKPTSKKKPPRS